MWPARPKSRCKRILQDIHHLWKGCFCRSSAGRQSAFESDPGDISNRHRYGPQNGEIFERAVDKTAEHAISWPPSIDGRLRRGASSRSDSELGRDVSPRPNNRTLSDESSSTVQEDSSDPQRPASARAGPKNVFQRWKTRRAAAACERARMRRGDLC